MTREPQDGSAGRRADPAAALGWRGQGGAWNESLGKDRDVLCEGGGRAGFLRIMGPGRMTLGVGAWGMDSALGKSLEAETRRLL